MCTSIRFKSEEEKDVSTVRDFIEKFNVDPKKYGWEGEENDLDTCLCSIDLEQFFLDHPEYKFEYDIGEWWQI